MKKRYPTIVNALATDDTLTQIGRYKFFCRTEEAAKQAIDICVLDYSGIRETVREHLLKQIHGLRFPTVIYVRHTELTYFNLPKDTSKIKEGDV